MESIDYIFACLICVALLGLLTIASIVIADALRDKNAKISKEFKYWVDGLNKEQLLHFYHVDLLSDDNSDEFYNMAEFSYVQEKVLGNSI
tara:strand:- start:1606 stop:1875 length:270 start_codon:yes stop_codon:yes gene_type:complete